MFDSIRFHPIVLLLHLNLFYYLQCIFIFSLYTTCPILSILILISYIYVYYTYYSLFYHSNPPRSAAEALELEMTAMRESAKTITSKDLKEAGVTIEECEAAYTSIFNKWLLLLDFHFYSFVIVRLALTWYTFAFILLHAELTVTFVAAVLITIFSFGSVAVLIPERIKRNARLPELSTMFPKHIE